MKNKKKIRKKKNLNTGIHKGSLLAETLYNCPYLIAVVVTSLIMMVYSDEIGIKAIASETGMTIGDALKSGIDDEKPVEDFVPDDVSDDKQITENLGEKYSSEMENAGKSKEENDEIASDITQENDDNSEKNVENSENEKTGITKFVFYEPKETDSYYYSDAGKIALTTEYPYTKESISYFNDAIFIGDSRTLGISDYAGLDEADFYCDSGMTVLKLLDAGGVTYQKTGKKEDLNQVLQQKHYGKVYIMLGMNDLGYGTTDMYLERYRKTVNKIREWQPDAIIYIMANLHVSREKNNPETEFNNININDKNAASALLANGTDIFYLDANPLFTDSEGFLNSELTFDGVHLYAKHYDAWREFLLEHAVEPKNTIQDEGAESDGGDSVK